MPVAQVTRTPQHDVDDSSLRLATEDLVRTISSGNHSVSPRAYTVQGYLHPGIQSGLLGYSGQLIQENTHGYLLGNGNRLFNPGLGRFSSPDSLSPFGKGGRNAYAYCEGDPVNHVDPTGQAGARTGLTKLLKSEGLLTRGLKKHLKLLKDPRGAGMTIEVVKVSGKEASTMSVSFSNGKFEITETFSSPAADLAGHYFAKGNIYVPAPPGESRIHLMQDGFKSVQRVPEGHALLAAHSTSVARQEANHGGEDHRDYIILSNTVSGVRSGR